MTHPTIINLKICNGYKAKITIKMLNTVATVYLYHLTPINTKGDNTQTSITHNLQEKYRASTHTKMQ